MEKKPDQSHEPPEPPMEVAPPFEPDPALFKDRESRRKPSEAEVRAAAERTKR
jgi:hypothetical protein